VQNLSLNLTPPPNAKPVQEASASNPSQANLGAEDAAQIQKKGFAKLLSNQLLQQRKWQQENVADNAMKNPLPESLAVDLDVGGVALMQDGLARLEEPAAAVQDIASQAPMQDMLIIQMQTPMAVNAVSAPWKPNSEAMTSIEAGGSAVANPLVAATTPILNNENTPKNTPGEIVARTNAMDDKHPEMAETVARLASASADSADATQSQATEPTFKDTLQMASSQVSQPMQAYNKVELSNASQALATSTTIYQTLGKPEWNQAVNQRVLWMVGAGEQSATLTLNPPELGPLKVVVQVDNQFVNTTFTSEDANVRQALEDGLQMLREKMQESGLQLGGTQVNAGGHSSRDEQQLTQNAAPSPHAYASSNVATSSTETRPQLKVSRGLVDTFA